MVSGHLEPRLARYRPEVGGRPRGRRMTGVGVCFTEDVWGKTGRGWTGLVRVDSESSSSGESLGLWANRSSFCFSTAS